MAANPKVSIDKTEAQFLTDESTYLEAVSSQEIITPGSQNTEAGLLRTVQGRLASAFVNVFEFGVSGSGDDTVAMQDAFTAGGNAVYYIPPGSYTLSGDITATDGSVVLAAGVTLTGGKITNATAGALTLVGLNTPLEFNIHDLVTLTADGVTDDEVEIRAAIAAIPNGSTLTFNGQKSYRAIADILISNKADIILDGRGAELVIDSGFRLRNTNTNITIRNFKFDGSNNSASKCVWAHDGTHTDIKVENLHGVDCGMGVQYHDTGGGRYQRMQVLNCTFLACVRVEGAIQFNDTAGPAHFSVSKCTVNGTAAGPGIRVNGTQIALSDNLIYGNVNAIGAIRVEGGDSIAVSGNAVAEFQDLGFQITGTPTNVVASGNTFNQASGGAGGDRIEIPTGLATINFADSNVVDGTSRTAAGTPISSVTPRYRGQIFFQETPPTFYMASGLTDTDWLPIS